MSSATSSRGEGADTRDRRREWLLVGIVLLGLVLVLFGSFLFGAAGRIASSPIGDTTRYFVFVRGMYVDELLSGNLPLWNPHLFSGVPFLGAFQTAVLYPPNVLYLIWPLDVALNLDFALHTALLAGSTFAWLRGRGLPMAGACVAAAMVALGAPGFLRVLAGQLTVLATFAWVPLLLLVIDRLETRLDRRWTLVGGATAALILLAGHPPTAYMAGLVCGLYCLWPLARSPHRWRLLAHLLVVATLGLGLAAAQWITGLAEGAESVRSMGMSWDFATSFSLPPENLLTFLVPEAFGNADAYKRSYFGRWFYWDASAYLGAVGFLLAVHGAGASRDRLRTISLVMALLLLLLALGKYTPLYSILYHIVPGFDQLRAPSKLMFFAGLFIAALAAQGVASLQVSSHRARTTAMVGAVFIALLVFLAATVALDESSIAGGRLVGWLAELNVDRVHTDVMLEDWRDFLVRSAALTALLLALAVALIVWTTSRRKTAVHALVALACAELLVFAWMNRGGARVMAEYLRRPALSDAIAAAGTDRVLSMGVSSDLAIREGGFATWGNESLVLLRYAELIAGTQARTVEELDNILGDPPDVHHPLLGMLRTRFGVDRQGHVEEYGDRLPRFLLLHAYEVVADRETSLRVLLDGEVDWRTTVVLEQEPRPAPRATALPRVASRIELLDESSDHFTLDVETSEPTILLITDAYARGWRVVGLGESAKQSYRLLPANHALRAIALDAGSHRLRIEYSPLAWRIGVGVSLATGLVCICVLAPMAWRRPRRPGAVRERAPGAGPATGSPQSH